MGYLVHSDNDRKKILNSLGIDNANKLFSSIPKKILKPGVKMPRGLSEKELGEKLNKVASLNRPLKHFSSFLGGGAYNHYIPAVVDYVTSLSQFYTTYTPYQPEISQGTLQYIFEFQSLICRLTGMEIGNASMYDGATSLAEAVLMASRVTGKSKVVMVGAIDPQYRETVKTYLYGPGMDIEEVGYHEGITDLDNLENTIDGDTCAVAIQNPNFFGCFEEVLKIRKLVDRHNDCLYIICANPLSLALLKPPSDYGADIVVGDAQVFGNPLSFGGPYLGYFAARKKYLRQIPGRIVGKTLDKDSKDAYVLTYQVREQHIRKAKATSNICSNHSLNALAATVYLSVLGEKGLKDLANICLQRANYFGGKLSGITHFRKKFKTKFFNELVVSTDLDTGKVLEKLRNENILGGIKLGDYYPGLSDSILVSFTEMNLLEDIEKYIDVLKSLEA